MKITILSLLLLLTLFCNGYAAAQEQEQEKKENYELQEQCRKNAEEFFKGRFGSGINYDDFGKRISTYTNRYNKRLNKCFILVHEVTFPNDKKKYHMSRGITLFDVVENKCYGFFGTGASEDSMSPCEMLDKDCYSEEEWDAIVKAYMED